MRWAQPEVERQLALAIELGIPRLRAHQALQHDTVAIENSHTEPGQMHFAHVAHILLVNNITI
jgi:hypothetical protein